MSISPECKKRPIQMEEEKENELSLPEQESQSSTASF